MSGRRHSDQQPGDSPLGDKIKAELRSALKLLFKSVEQHAVSVIVPGGFTTFVTALACESVGVNCSVPEPLVSADPVLVLKDVDPQARPLRLITPPPLAESAPCHWEPVLCNEPVLEEMQVQSASVPLDTLTLGLSQLHAWPVRVEPVKIQQQPIGKLPVPRVKQQADTQPIATRSHSLLDGWSNVPVKNTPRYYALPIRKASIPPHRFSLSMREKFRQALAAKAGTHEGNVQLKMIFERLNMGLFSAIQADDAGNLMCTPKSELLGRNAETSTGRAILRQLSVGSEASYLVVGVRLDNQADIRALVPVEAVMDTAFDGEGDTSA